MYELSSGQQINLQKSSYFASKHICSRRRLRIQHVLGCQARAFPITYLGAPLFKDRAKQSYFEEISNKTISKIEGWYNQYLSFAGKITLIKSVLSSIPIHILSCMVVPKAIILKVDSLLKNLLWANKWHRRLHWVSWAKVFSATSEGSLGIRSLIDTIFGLQGKLAWKVYMGQSLWARICH